jgi:peptidoglycan hydrolase-like protein with peptidoglycan-binding domain
VRHKLLIVGAAALILASAAAGAVLTRRSAPEKPRATLPPATAQVTRTTLVETRTVSGTLGYGDPVPVRAAVSGTLTWIAPVGSTVRHGEPLFKVDERPVVELYGSLPLYRTLRVGEQGADVRELEQNLADLGYTGFAADDVYTAATAEAVRGWQAGLGLPQSGAVEPAQAVVTPGPVRIAQQTARVGDVVAGDAREGGGSVLGYTGTARLVTVDLKVADRNLAVEARTATVTVLGAGTVEGRIAEIGTVAKGQPQATSAPGAPSPVASEATIRVTVTIADQAALGPLDAAPVDVALVSAEREDVLAVPVAALLALPQGGFGLEVVDGRTTRIVPVKTGLFASGRVEVTGEGIAQGVKVGVPR